MKKRRRPIRAKSVRNTTAMTTQHIGASSSEVSMSGWNPQSGSADSDLLADLGTLISRSRDMARNNGLMAGGIQTLKDNVIGSTLRLSSLPDYRLLGWSHAEAREWGNYVESHFHSWADTTECDAAHELNLLGLTLQAFGGAMLNGDALALPLWLPSTRSQWCTRLMMVEADRLSTPPLLEHRHDIRGGIERDYYGAPVAYYILKNHPGDIYGTYAFQPDIGLDAWERIPALTEWGRKRVIHMHDKERTGQSRGKPIVASVMKELHIAGRYTATELDAALANSLVAAFLESDLDPESAAELFGADPRKAWHTSAKEANDIRLMKGAGVVTLPIGTKLSPFLPGRPNASFEAFMLSILRHIATGLNMPYELLAKDFSRTNYSSARAAMLEAWRYFNGRRRWLMDVWLRPVYELWMEEAVNAGVIEAPDFYKNRYAYTRCKFILSGRGWVDPTKEANASGIRMGQNTSTLEDECAEQGLDWEEVLEQRAYEKQRETALGLQPVYHKSASAKKEEEVSH